MKRRSVVSKAEWSSERRQWYRNECESILYKVNSKIIFRNQKVYLESKNQEILFHEISKPGTMWFETWLKLES